MRVLVVEDDRKVADALQEGLEAEQYEVTVERTRNGACCRINAETFDVILLDIVLPDGDGLELLRSLRQTALSTPVLVLSARSGLPDRILGMDSGADGYLTKPFAFEELLARIRALLRRNTDRSLQLSVDDLTMDLTKREVRRAGQPVELTSREFQLLEVLMRHEREVVSRETIARDVWRESVPMPPLDNVIDVLIARLRQKIDVAPVKLIHTVRGVGFMLCGDGS